MLRATVLLLTVLTGFSALVYEVAWQKSVGTLLGSHSEATAAVLALFLGGLSLGYSLFGRVTRRVVERAEAAGRPPRLLLLYGAVEASIGVHALAFPWLFAGVRALSSAIPHPAGGLGFALDVALVALLILPPCILMGGTIPILTQALARSLADATRIHAFVYAFNTAGAFAGALAGGLVLIPWLGLQRVVLLMGAVNLFAGATLALLGLRRRAVFVAPAAVPEGEAGPETPQPIVGYAWVALLLGFAAMVVQTVLIRIGGLALGSSQFTFAMVVAVFVLCIALGSFAVSALPRIGPHLLVGALWLLVLMLGALYPMLPNAPWAAHVIRTWFRDMEPAFYPYQIAVFLGALLVLALPVGLSGAMLPLIFHRLRREIGDLGAAAGRLYAWNTVGSLLGALLGGYLLLFWLDLDQVYLVALGAVVTSAVLLSIRAFGLPALGTLAFLLLPLLASLAWMPRWEPARLASGAFRMRRPSEATFEGPTRYYRTARASTRIGFYDDDPNTSVSVIESVAGDRVTDHAIATNGKPDGSIAVDYPTMALAALVPALFADRVESGFVIGFGTGVTVGELAALDSVQRVTVAEISPGVIEAGRFFEPFNQGALGNPKTRVVVSDAYRALLRSDEHYDVIASEPSNPWVTGVEMLFSREFLEAARDRLRPGGVYAQWFHLYENDSEIVELVLRTYASVFDRVAVWYALGPDLLLLGFRDPEGGADLDRLRARAAQPDLAAGLRRGGVDGLAELLAHELMPVGVVNAAGFEGEIQTLVHPVLSYRAARAFFRGGLAELPPTVRPEPSAIGAAHSMLRRFQLEHGGVLPEPVQAALVGEACEHQPQLCATLVASWMHQQPVSPARDALLARLRTRAHLAQHLEPGLLASLASLFAPQAAAAPAASVADATRLSELFLRYYHHGAPFSRDALAAVWARCQDGAPQRCATALAAAEERLGPLGRAAHAARVPGG